MSAKEKQTRWFFLIAIFIVALYLRLSNWPFVFSDRTVSFFGEDPYYHMRRILLAIRHFPLIPQFDYYINYPQGLSCHHGPFFDLMIASIAILAKPFSSSLYTTEAIAAIFPAIIGAFSVFVVYLIGKALFDYRVGFIAAAVSAVMHLMVSISEIGRTDYHVLEALLSGLIFLAIFYPLKNYANLSRRKQIFYSILAGLSLAIGLFTSSVMIIFLVIFSLFISIQLLINYFFKKDLRYLFSLSLSVLFSALIILMISIVPFNWKNLSFDFDRLSLFQPAFVIFLIIEVSVLYFLLVLPKKYRIHLKPRNLVLIILFLSILFIFYYYSYKPISQNLLESWKYFSVQDEWLKSVSEAKPLLLKYDPFRLKSHLVLSGAILYFGRAFFLIPLGFVFLGYLVIKKGKEGYLLFFILSLLTMVASLYQKRFLSLFAMSACLLMALMINGIYLRLSVIKWKKISFFYPAICVVIGIFLFSFYPKGNKDPSLGYQQQPGLNELLVWLKDNSPQTSYFLEPDKIPEYGVLSVWGLGPRIVYISRRPVVANNLHNNKRGIETVAKFILASDQNQAKAILEENKIKYIITTSLDNGVQLFDYARFIKVDPIKYIKLESRKSGRGYAIRTAKEIGYYRLIFNQLHVLDGTNYDFIISKGNSTWKETIEALGNFRLIYETSYLRPTSGMINKEVSNLKIFEYVTGTTVTGKALPNAEVVAKLSVKTNTDRVFLYKTIAKTNSDGNFKLILPYSTKGLPYESKATGEYELSCKQFKKQLSVKEDDVKSGNTIQIDLTSAQ